MKSVTQTPCIRFLDAPPSPKKEDNDTLKRRRYPFGSTITNSPVSVPSSKKRPTRRIAFAQDLAVVHTIPHASEYSSGERKDLWYSGKELKSFKNKRRQIRLRIEQGLAVEDECLRGFEGWTPEGARERFRNIQQSLKAVLDEQVLQDMDGRENPELLARIYAMHTMRTKDAAYKRGLLDMRECLMLQPLPMEV